MVLSLLFFLLSCKYGKEELQQPNIILIVADDLGYSDLSCYGSPLIETPYLDQLAAGGMQFMNGYAAAPLCSPTRASIVTGLNPARINLTEHIHGHPPTPSTQMLVTPKTEQGLDTSLTTIPEVLKNQGYQTAHIGKWHLGGGATSPQFHGYDMVYGGSWAGLPATFFYPFFNGEAYPELKEDSKKGDYLTDVLTDKALRYIETNKEEKFYLSLCYYAPHVPIEGKEDLVEKYQAKADQIGVALPNPHYAAMVEAIDNNVGRLMQKVEELGLSKNTLIVFTSDNGGLDVKEFPAFARHTPPTTNAPLRAGKGYIYEGGIREPFILHWKGVINHGIHSAVPISTNDLFNTFSSLSKAKNRTSDGIDLSPLFQGESLPDRNLYWHFPHYSPQRGKPGGVIRSGDYKLITWYETDKVELFNLSEDIGETNNLAKQMQNKVQEMKYAFNLWKKEVGAIEATLNPEYMGQ